MYDAAQNNSAFKKPATTSTFSITTRQVPSQYRYQFYADFGVSEAGPWGIVCLNGTELSVGWLPADEPHRPSRSNTVRGTT